MRLGDDAQELACRGYTVTAFDVSPTAITPCRERFPRPPVLYRAADVLNLQDGWRGSFGLVMEINIIQSLVSPGKIGDITKAPFVLVQFEHKMIN